MVSIQSGANGRRVVDIVDLASKVVVAPAPILNQLMVGPDVLVPIEKSKIVNILSLVQVYS